MCEFRIRLPTLRLREFITPSLLALPCFGTLWTSLFDFLNYCVWLRITEEVSGPGIRIWSILLIQSGLKWFKQVDVSFHIKTTWWVSTAGGPGSPRGHMKPSSTADFGWFVAFESIKIFRVQTWLNCDFVGLLHHPFWLLPCFGSFWASLFNFLELLYLAKDHWRGSSTIWSILLIQSDLKWCTHLSRRLFSYLIWLDSFSRHA